jgi:hypothetical protein
MKKLNHLLFAATFATALTLTLSAHAESRALNATTVSRTTWTPDTQQAVTPARVPSPDYGITASPRIQLLRSEQPKSIVATPSTSVASSTAGTDDGIAASPRLRLQMSERPVQFQIAPLK